MPQDNPTKVAAFSGKWSGGCNSLDHPSWLLKNQYAFGENVINRGGIVQTRPGYRYITSITGDKLQGMTIFEPKNSNPYMLVAVDGLIYTSPYPFTEFTKLTGLNFSSSADIIVFQIALKSTKLNSDGSLSLIEPYPVVVIQDGETQAGYWDGDVAKHLNPFAPFYGTPPGLWMQWSSSRLWVARGSRVYASDLADPLTFSENTYLAERSNFGLPGECTGLIQTSDLRNLLAFTETTTTAFQASIRDRVQWQQTPDFQQLLLPAIGCVAGKSCCNQYGVTYWFTLSGLISLNAALLSKQTNAMATVDDYMMRSRRDLTSDLSGICVMPFENILLASVPSANRFNSHTWVMDQHVDPTAGVNQVWTGVWSGTRPVEFSKVTVGGRERCYFAAYDTTPKDATHIHIWEAFQTDRKDFGGRIACQLETAAIAEDGGLRVFKYAEINVVEVLGLVTLDVYFAGLSGGWHQVGSITLNAKEGSLSVDEELTETTIIQSYKPQSRTIRTREFNSQGAECSAETKYRPGIDKAFRLLFQWRGRMGIKDFKIITEASSVDPKVGGCTADESAEVLIVNESGETLTV